MIFHHGDLINVETGWIKIFVSLDFKYIIKCDTMSFINDIYEFKKSFCHIENLTL